jgi:hypothetical protein
MLDVAVAYNRYKFLGEEFLTWLWYIIENNQPLLKSFDQDFIGLEIGNRIVFENRRKESAERITIKGEEAGLEEGILALKNGALVTELNMIYRSADLAWQFTLKGESLNISSLNIPKTELPDSDEDLEGFVIEKLFLYDKSLQFLKKIFTHFVSLRISNKWQRKEISSIRNWINSP